MLLLMQALTPSPASAEDTVCEEKYITHVGVHQQLVPSEGAEIYLADIKMPEYWPENSPYRSWPFGAQAHALLQEKVLNKQVRLLCGNEKRLSLAGGGAYHVRLADGTWLNAHMVVEGAAFAFPDKETSFDTIEALYEQEDLARQRQVGLWSYAQDSFQETPLTVKPGRFAIVRFALMASGESSGTLYLNTGENWRSDFTVEVPAAVSRRWSDVQKSNFRKVGLMLEVRGWVIEKNGPAIQIRHPLQLRRVP